MNEACVWRAGASRAHARGSKPTDEIHARGSINRGWEEWLPSEAEVEGDSAGAAVVGCTLIGGILGGFSVKKIRLGTTMGRWRSVLRKVSDRRWTLNRVMFDSNKDNVRPYNERDDESVERFQWRRIIVVDPGWRFRNERRERFSRERPRL